MTQLYKQIKNENNDLKSFLIQQDQSPGDLQTKALSPGILLLTENKVKLPPNIDEQLQHHKRILNRIPPGELRAIYLHDSIDQMMKADEEEAKMDPKTKPVTCRKGCSFCCHRMVYVTSDEAALLTSKLEQLQPNNQISMSTISELESKAQSYPPEKPEEFWKLPYSHSRCIFLGNNHECTVYDNRPASCRLHSVVSHPKFCSKEATKEGKDSNIKQMVTLDPEIFYSSAIELDRDNYTAMPQAILREIKSRKENPIDNKQKQIQMMDYIKKMSKFKDEQND